MKRFFLITSIFLAIIVLVFVLSFIIKKTIVLLESPVLATLPEYKDSERYISDGFQDYTNYHKYYYDNSEKVKKKLENSIYFKPVSDEDFAEITAYFNNFEGWLQWVDFEDKYDFDMKLVDKNDFWYVKSKYAQESEDEKFYDYDLYFFDIQSMTLYYIHNNI